MVTDLEDPSELSTITLLRVVLTLNLYQQERNSPNSGFLESFSAVTFDLTRRIRLLNKILTEKKKNNRSNGRGKRERKKSGGCKNASVIFLPPPKYQNIGFLQMSFLDRFFAHLNKLLIYLQPKAITVVKRLF